MKAIVIAVGVALIGAVSQNVQAATITVDFQGEVTNRQGNVFESDNLLKTIAGSFTYDPDSLFLSKDPYLLGEFHLEVDGVIVENSRVGLSTAAKLKVIGELHIYDDFSYGSTEQFFEYDLRFLFPLGTNSPPPTADEWLKLIPTAEINTSYPSYIKRYEADGNLGSFIEFDVTFAQASDVTVTPEPASLAIWGLGAAGCAIAGHRRRRQAA